MIRLLISCFLFYVVVNGDNCWWSGCQPNNWAQRGCSPGFYQIDTQPCDGSGDRYRCCPSGHSGHSVQSIQWQGEANESGMCSWYGADGEIPPGHPTASGEGFDRFAMKAAHKTLPFGTRIRVTNAKNGKSVDVTVNDRGPYIHGRIVDLTYAAFGMIANRDIGVASCSYVKI